MGIVAGLLGLFLVAGVLRDAFETIILPRRVSGVRISKVFYRLSWRPWAAIARRMPPSDRRESFLGVYGPLSLILLLVLVFDVVAAQAQALAEPALEISCCFRYLCCHRAHQ